jgi:hypothetical protein
MYLLLVRHVFVHLHYELVIFHGAFKDKHAYLWVEEERVHAPRERLRAAIEIVIRWRLGELAIILFAEMSRMLLVLLLDIVRPDCTGRN